MAVSEVIARDGDFLEDWLAGFTILLAILLVVSLCIGSIIAFLDKYLINRLGPEHESLAIVFQQVYRELMTIGAMSFTLFILFKSSVGKQIASIAKLEYKLFEKQAELLHAALFVVILVYSFTVSVVLLTTEVIAYKFRTLERKIAAKGEVQHSHVMGKPVSRSVLWYLVRPDLLIPDILTNFKMFYIFWRGVTTNQYRLSSKTFNFGLYMTICLRHSVARLIHINWLTWLVVFVFCLVNLNRVQLHWRFDVLHGKAVLIFIGGISVIFTFVLWLKSRRMMSQMASLPSQGYFLPGTNVEDLKMERREQEKVFWFRSRGFYQSCMKLMLLTLAIQVGWLMIMADTGLIFSNREVWVWPIVTGLSFAVLMTITFLLVPRYATLTSVGRWTNETFIDQVLPPSEYRIPSEYTQRYKTGQVLINEGEQNSHLYMILSGQISVWKGQSKLVSLESGEIIGEMSFLDPTEKASATVVADSPTEVMVVTAEQMCQILEEDPRQAAKFYHVLANKLSGRLRAALGKAPPADGLKKEMSDEDIKRRTLFKTSSSEAARGARDLRHTLVSHKEIP